MPKENKEAESQPIVEVNDAAVSGKPFSVDQDNGIVVFKTKADEGAEFTCVINGKKVKAVVENGQLWFYAGTSIGQTPAITLL